MVCSSKEGRMDPSISLRTNFSMTAKDWFKKAREEKFAIGAFNIDTFDIFKAVMVAAAKKKSPVMVEFSPGEVKYFGLRNAVDMVINAREEYKIPILLNLDHGKPVDLCMEAIEQPGFDDIHFDGSDLDFEKNVSETKKVVDAAHKKGLLVEGEIDKVSGSSEAHDENVDPEKLKESYTKPEKAAKFVATTKVDIFASIFGNIHGTFPIQPDLDIDLLKKIAKAIPETFLSLHGGSGIAAEQVKAAIGEGIVKINVNTELRVAYRDALTEELGENPKEYKVYDLSSDVIMAVASVVENKIDVFGSANKI